VKKSFFILLAFLSLLIGVQTLISCSDSNIEDPPPPPSNVKPPITIDLPPSGHYPDGLSFTVPEETENGIVRCETSGAVPNENSTIESGSTLNFSGKNAILQCAYFKEGKTVGKTMRTYIIERLPNLPIVSIAVDPEKMFKSSTALYKSSFKPGADCGMYASSSFYSDEQLPIYVDFFEKEAKHAWSYPAGIKIHGGCSRQWPKKSVIVSFKESYGQKNLKYPLFPDFPNLKKFKHFMLRNNGNNYDYDYIRDMLMSSLTEGLDIDYQKGRAVVVFYNGEYYGIHNLRERANSDYFETNYNIDEDFIDLVKVDSGGVVSRGSDDDYQNIVRWLEGVSLADDNNFKQLEKRMDVDNFTNHFQSRIFYKDCDWPGKNMKRWRSATMQPKWRWLLYDTDHGFGSWGSSMERRDCGTMGYITATNGPPWPNPPHSTFMMRKLLENQNYKNAFINRFSLLIATYFTTEKMNARRSELMAQINSEIPFDERRWRSKSERDLPKTMERFAGDRPAEMQNNITSYVNNGSPVNFTLKGSGNVFVHNFLLPKESVTFKAYPSVPITIKAGTGFKSWSDGDTNPERTVLITKDSTLTANF